MGRTDCQRAGSVGSGPPFILVAVRRDRHGGVDRLSVLSENSKQPHVALWAIIGFGAESANDRVCPANSGTSDRADGTDSARFRFEYTLEWRLSADIALK